MIELLLYLAIAPFVAMLTCFQIERHGDKYDKEAWWEFGTMLFGALCWPWLLGAMLLTALNRGVSLARLQAWVAKWV